MARTLLELIISSIAAIELREHPAPAVISNYATPLNRVSDIMLAAFTNDAISR